MEEEVERALAEERSRPSRSAQGAGRKRHQKGSDVEDEPPQYDHCLNLCQSFLQPTTQNAVQLAHFFRLNKPSEMQPRSCPHWIWVRNLHRHVIWAFFRPKSNPVPGVVDSIKFQGSEEQVDSLVGSWLAYRDVE